MGQEKDSVVVPSKIRRKKGDDTERPALYKCPKCGHSFQRHDVPLWLWPEGEAGMLDTEDGGSPETLLSRYGGVGGQFGYYFN